MKAKNIKWVFISGVDNILAKLVDSVLLGLAIDNKVQAAGKSVKKACPEEKVGIFCSKNGRPGVVEYTEISDEMSKQKDMQGHLRKNHHPTDGQSPAKEVASESAAPSYLHKHPFVATYKPYEVSHNELPWQTHVYKVAYPYYNLPPTLHARS